MRRNDKEEKKYRRMLEQKAEKIGVKAELAEAKNGKGYNLRIEYLIEGNPATFSQEVFIEKPEHLHLADGYRIAGDLLPTFVEVTMDRNGFILRPMRSEPYSVPIPKKVPRS